MKGSSCGMKKPTAMKKGGMAKKGYMSGGMAKKDMPMMKKGGMAKKSGKGGMPEAMLAKMGRNMAKKATQK